MKVKLGDLTSFFLNPPALSEMVHAKRDGRKGKSRVLIIVPSYHDGFRLKKLLRYLRRQTFRKFDVAVILAKDDEYVGAAGLSVLQVKRKMDFGFAGSVYLGQQLAMQGKYEYYLFTDVDRVPHKKGVLQSLYDEAEESGADFVYGNNMVKGYFIPSAGFFDYANPAIIRSNCVFGLIRTSTLERTGLYALPLYIGYEDVEFEYRLKKAIRSEKYLNSTIYESYSSPAKNAFLKNFSGDSFGIMYLYPTMVCLYNCPQTANHLGLLRKLRMFFVVLLAQKFGALRAPALAVLEKSARMGRFGKTSGTGVSSEIKISTAKAEISEDYLNYTANAPLSNLARMLCAVFFPPEEFFASAYSPLFDYFIHDRFFVYDERRKKTLLFEWKRKPGMPLRFAAFLSALSDSLVAVAKSSCFGLAGDRGMFHLYGLAKRK